MNIEKIKSRLSHRGLGTDIATVLALKLVLIFSLWLAFFSDPMDRELTPESMENLLLETPTDGMKGEHHGQ